jgi:hypothetical protein
MSRYTVVWDPDLESRLIIEWTDADSQMRALLTHAANWIDATLVEFPERAGQELENTPYHFAVVPDTGSYLVRVVYKVFADDRLVRVLNIRIREDTD